jgi:RNA polymerase sigma-70 factor (ECF subfamily)
MEDLDDAEEIVQQVFVNFWEQRENIDIENSARAYLFRSVRNACLNKKKHIKIREQYKEHNEMEINSNAVDLDKILNASELDTRIRKAIDQLPPERRKIFIMSRYDEKKYQEIANELNISIKTVENQIGSALKFLRKELIDYLTILILLFLK